MGLPAQPGQPWLGSVYLLSRPPHFYLFHLSIRLFSFIFFISSWTRDSACRQPGCATSSFIRARVYHSFHLNYLFNPMLLLISNFRMFFVFVGMFRAIWTCAVNARAMLVCAGLCWHFSWSGLPLPGLSVFFVSGPMKPWRRTHKNTTTYNHTHDAQHQQRKH